jgi:hypothetical protein
VRDAESTVEVPVGEDWAGAASELASGHVRERPGREGPALRHPGRRRRAGHGSGGHGADGAGRWTCDLDLTCTSLPVAGEVSLNR